MKTLARALRRNMTDAERRLWYHLRARRFHGYKFRRQFVINCYIVDFVCIDAGLVVEVDGGQHGDRQREDAKRTAWLEANGFRVLRFWNHEVLQDTEAVLERLHSALAESPLPNPSPRGRGA